MPKTLPRNGELADQLDLLADLSEILDEESFKVVAYRRAAGRIREAAVPIAELALDGKAKELPGIGKTIEAKVVEVVEDGEMHALTKRRGMVPAGVVDFLRLPGVGPKTAARIWTQLGITTLDGLRTAAESGRLRDLSGLGAKSEEKILKALDAGVGTKVEDRRLLAVALPAVRRVVAELQAHPSALAVSEAGSVRRRRETVRDVERSARPDRRVLQRRLGLGSRCPRGHEGDRDLARRSSLRPSGRPGGLLRQRPPALHGLEGPQHQAAGGSTAARALDLRVRGQGRGVG
jgi:DNA polymerase (family 10)